MKKGKESHGSSLQHGRVPMCVGVDEGELVNVDECPWEQKEFQKCDGRPIVRLSIGFSSSAAQRPRAKEKLIISLMITDTAHISRGSQKELEIVIAQQRQLSILRCNFRQFKVTNMVDEFNLAVH